MPYNLKAAPSDYPFEVGMHTVLGDISKYELFGMKDEATLFD